MEERTCSNCGRPLRPPLRGFCPRCVTTPSQRRRLERAAGAVSSEGPLARALDIAGAAVLALAVLAVVIWLWTWLGATVALVALAVFAVLGALGFLGAG